MLDLRETVDSLIDGNMLVLLRVFHMQAPPDLALQWDKDQIAGPYRWLFRLWEIVANVTQQEDLLKDLENSCSSFTSSSSLPSLSLSYPPSRPPSPREIALLLELKSCVGNVTSAFEKLPPPINTAISSLMKLSNEIKEWYVIVWTNFYIWRVGENVMVK